MSSQIMLKSDYLSPLHFVHMTYAVSLYHHPQASATGEHDPLDKWVPGPTSVIVLCHMSKAPALPAASVPT